MPDIRVRDGALEFGVLFKKRVPLDDITEITLRQMNSSWFVVRTQSRTYSLYNFVYGTLRLEEVMKRVADECGLVIYETSYVLLSQDRLSARWYPPE